MAQTFDIDVTTQDGTVVARLAGELDLVSSTGVVESLTGALASTGVRRLVVDMSGVTFCDSSGLGALLDVRRAAVDHGVPMVLRDVTRQVARLLDLADVDGWLTRE